MAIAPPGCHLSYRVSGLHRGQNPAGQEAYQPVDLPGTRGQHGGSQGTAGPVAIRERGREVLANRAHSAPESRREGHPDRLCGWPQGLP